LQVVDKFLVCLVFLASLSSSLAHNTWYGSTGLIQVPTTSLVRSQETALSIFSSFGGEDPHFGWAASFAFSDRVELSLSDTAGWDKRRGSSTVFGLKYVPASTLAVGVLMDSNTDYQHTLYGILGSPENSVYLGLGANFGNGSAKKALLGNYSSVSQEMETFFFMAGARMDLSHYYPSLEAMLEFNGDTMSMGLGLIPKTNWDVQLDYMTSGDLMTEGRYVLSVGTRF
jgi:hypothetical protein